MAMSKQPCQHRDRSAPHAMLVVPSTETIYKRRLSALANVNAVGRGTGLAAQELKRSATLSICNS